LSSSQALSEWTIGFPGKLKVISHSPNLAEIVEKCPRGLISLLCKRLMFRIAERIAELERAEGIVTGETLSDKSGLTLHNFRVEDEAVKNYPIYRPLQGLDKPEIEQLARKLDIKEISIPIMSKQKAVSRRQNHVAPAKLEDVKHAEENLKTDEMIEDSIKSLRTLN